MEKRIWMLSLPAKHGKGHCVSPPSLNNHSCRRRFLLGVWRVFSLPPGKEKTSLNPCRSPHSIPEPAQQGSLSFLSWKNHNLRNHPDPESRYKGASGFFPFPCSGREFLRQFLPANPATGAFFWESGGFFLWRQAKKKPLLILAVPRIQSLNPLSKAAFLSSRG